ncbi:hypothetical protein H9L12_00820 [Sphingomonas rhizophila]|uniref:DUF5681 domain-containing protein n=1 Tax=Sphingomonas rhizophila TaxID=2071607 RepID=A0A7G9SBK5_9SPHN|nr:DUF5681 domain-containing protein [Sphingomonas rhizophila]QNN65230.1 hypothetical protein H9L12_00820 [Sphingomonas rhizophila]
MSGGRFVKGQSGNPNGRPKARRPNVSAFDIIFDKKLSSSQGGVEQEISVDEALELQTYQGALKGSKMAVRAVLKMIAKREAAVLKTAPPGLHTRWNGSGKKTRETPTMRCCCWG